ncbi:hypothetical protein QUC31_010978 [Theobroma cacao]
MEEGIGEEEDGYDDYESEYSDDEEDEQDSKRDGALANGAVDNKGNGSSSESSDNEWKTFYFWFFLFRNTGGVFLFQNQDVSQVLSKTYLSQKQKIKRK